MYNREGAFLDFGSNTLGCTDRAYYYSMLSYVLEHGDSTFVVDSIILKRYTPNDSSALANLFDDNTRATPDLSRWTMHTEKTDARLNSYSRYLRTLQGDNPDVHNLYEEYLLVWAFSLSGRSGLTSVLIRETIRDVKKLNKEFDNRIQIILINVDELDWMN